ncbi:MAG: hypothetical protein KIT63_03490 [Rhodoferax sp.]|nr:hypothetical protein [Rhodoferax sp.]
MSDEKTQESFCEMRLLLEEFRDGTSTYAVETGLKRSFVLLGSIEDLDYGLMGDGPCRPGAFHNKKVRVDVETPVDQEYLQRVRSHRLDSGGKIHSSLIDVGEESTYDIGKYCGPSPCGSAVVRAAVCGEKLELDDGDEFESEPVEMNLSLPLDAFEGIRRQAKEAYDCRRILSAKIRLVGNALPPMEERLQAWFGLKLAQLDISKDQGYAIQSFEISRTRLFFYNRGRVEYLRPKEGEGYGVGLSIMLSSVRYELAIERPVDSWPVDTSISCLGRITNAHGKPYQGVEVEVKFLEHETNRFGETPKQAYFGNFEYWPKDPEPNGLNASFNFYLRYMPSDARNLIQELVGRGPNANVVLSVLLAVEHAAFDGTSKVAGNVRRYGFDVSQPLVATELDRAASKADIERLSKAVSDLHELTESIRTANEEKHRLDRPATTGDVELLRDTVTQTNAVPVLAQLFEYLQYMNSRIAWIWWFSLGALAAGIAAYVASTWPWR